MNFGLRQNNLKVNYNEERQNETLFAPAVVTSSTPKRRPTRLEPLIEEIESSDNTPSYELKEVCIYATHTDYAYIVHVIRAPGPRKVGGSVSTIVPGEKT